MGLYDAKKQCQLEDDVAEIEKATSLDDIKELLLRVVRRLP
jgi:hypothetical protein